MATTDRQPATEAGRDLLRYTEGLPDLFQTPTWLEGIIAIEAEASADALDAERLGEAVFRVGISRWKDERSESLPWAVEHQQEWAHWLGQAQTAIAREYAALDAAREDGA